MWKEFNKNKPEHEGWYQCTVEVKGQQRYVMQLYWYPKRQKFIDNIRADVCQTYNVVSITGERLYDIGQDRTESVVAWKNISDPYMVGFAKEEMKVYY